MKVTLDLPMRDKDDAILLQFVAKLERDAAGWPGWNGRDVLEHGIIAYELSKKAGRQKEKKEQSSNARGRVSGDEDYWTRRAAGSYAAQYIDQSE